jgi:TolA-binding protein
MQEPPRAPQDPLPRAGDVAPYVEDDRPATLADIRNLRRWLAVAAVWAVAATAIAVFALLEANKDDSGDRDRAAGELGRVQRQLNERIDDLEARMDELPTSEDLSKLDGRLSEVEDGADQAATQSERLTGRVDELEGRIDELETRVEELEQSNTGTETTP